MIILGLDIATSCGHGLIERPGSLSSARCGAWHCEGENGEEKAAHLAGELSALIKASRPAFAAIEEPQRRVAQFKRKGQDLAGQRSDLTINPNALQLSAMAGAAVAILNAWRVPWGLIPVNTWRAVYYGKGFAPPKRAIKKRDGSIVYEDDWKQAAIVEAQRAGIALPATKEEQRDAAEAIAVAVCWERCTFIPARHRDAFVALRTGQARAAA